MKKNIPPQSIVELVEDMIKKNEDLLLDYTVDDLIQMAMNGDKVKINGSFIPPARSSQEE